MIKQKVSKLLRKLILSSNKKDEVCSWLFHCSQEESLITIIFSNKNLSCSCAYHNKHKTSKFWKSSYRWSNYYCVLVQWQSEVADKTKTPCQPLPCRHEELCATLVRKWIEIEYCILECFCIESHTVPNSAKFSYCDTVRSIYIWRHFFAVNAGYSGPLSRSHSCENQKDLK